MTPQQQKRIGKFLSLVLRHRPEVLGLELDEQGWTNVDTLLHKLAATDKAINREELELIVRNNNKQRYAFSEDGSSIRAQQGHSVQVNLDYEPIEPPEWLFHGTVDRFLNSIMTTGLQRRNRHHVHLSSDRETAINVGQRRGRPIILRIKANEMHKAGFLFFRSGNGVWLTEQVPPEFIHQA